MSLLLRINKDHCASPTKRQLTISTVSVACGRIYPWLKVLKFTHRSNVALSYDWTKQRYLFVMTS